MTCKRCNGSGEIPAVVSVRPSVWNSCPDCSGSGESEPCPKCGEVVPADIEAKKYKRGLRMAQIHAFEGPYYHICNECLETYNAMLEAQMEARREFFKGIEKTWG